MEFRILGPVQAYATGRPVDLGDRKQRLVLAVLLLEPNQLVPLGRLVDLLWRDAPPSSARRTVQAHLSRLRTALSRTGVALIRRGPGYQLECDPAAIDAHRFRELVDVHRYVPVLLNGQVGLVTEDTRANYRNLGITPWPCW